MRIDHNTNTRDSIDAVEGSFVSAECRQSRLVAAWVLAAQFATKSSLLLFLSRRPTTTVYGVTLQSWWNLWRRGSRNTICGRQPATTITSESWAPFGAQDSVVVVRRFCWAHFTCCVTFAEYISRVVSVLLSTFHESCQSIQFWCVQFTSCVSFAEYNSCIKSVVWNTHHAL